MKPRQGNAEWNLILAHFFGELAKPYNDGSWLHAVLSVGRTFSNKVEPEQYVRMIQLAMGPEFGYKQIAHRIGGSYTFKAADSGEQDLLALYEYCARLQH